MRTAAIHFFQYQAGFARRQATALARAEHWALNECLSFEWRQNIDVSGRGTWACLMHNRFGAILQVEEFDFGPIGNPWSCPSRRIIEAQLAVKQLRGE
jgi:hypothetical protein